MGPAVAAESGRPADSVAVLFADAIVARVAFLDGARLAGGVVVLGVSAVWAPSPEFCVNTILLFWYTHALQHHRFPVLAHTGHRVERHPCAGASLGM